MLRIARLLFAQVAGPLVADVSPAVLAQLGRIDLDIRKLPASMLAIDQGALAAIGIAFLVAAVRAWLNLHRSPPAGCRAYELMLWLPTIESVEYSDKMIGASNSAFAELEEFGGKHDIKVRGFNRADEAAEIILHAEA